MFNIEVKLKIHERDVSWETFAAVFLTEALKSSFEEIRPQFAAVPREPVNPQAAESGNRKAEPRIVNIDEAARLLGIKPATVRAYVARRKISSVRIGCRSPKVNRLECVDFSMR
jgi:excisionase family DNA binding protein